MIDIGICHVQATPSDSYLQMAAELESLGVDRLWIPDQDFNDDPFVMAAHTGLATTSLKIGIGITSPLLRHPMNLARAGASLCRLLGDRFLLGLGTGNVKNVLEPLGQRPAKPLASLSNGFSQTRALLAGESARMAPDKPEVALGEPAPGLPLYIGARGPRTLSFAGTRADGVLIESRAAGTSFADALAHVQAGRDQREPGGTTAPFDIGLWQVISVTDDPGLVYHRHREWIARMIQAGPASAMRLAGVSEASLERLEAARDPEQVAAAAAQLTEEDCAAVVVAGPAAHVAHVLGRAVAQGATSINLVGTSTMEATVETAERLIKDVLPALPDHPKGA